MHSNVQQLDGYGSDMNDYVNVLEVVVDLITVKMSETVLLLVLPFERNVLAG